MSPNGAGKTTVFNVITGVYQPSSGDVRFAGRSIAGQAPHRIARLGSAKATPTMVVIDQKGILAYIGAIDDKPSTNLDDIKTAKNYVVAALDEIAAGKPLTVSATRAYGCSVKYKTS